MSIGNIGIERAVLRSQEIGEKRLKDLGTGSWPNSFGMVMYKTPRL